MSNEIDNLDSQHGSPTGDVAIGDETGRNHLVSMQVVQDIYNEITGKSEELSRGYDISYQVSFADIKQLNYKVTQLYEQYNICSSNCSVTVYHEKDQKQVFSSFERFELYDSGLLSPTESILIKYNFMIILPKTKRSQSYTVSVRVGSKLSIMKKLEEDAPIPSGLIKMLSGRNAQVTVEYIDYTVARNFLDSIDGWFHSLNSKKLSWFVQILQKNSHYIPPIAKFSVGIFSGYLVYKYSASLVPNDSTDLNNLFLATIGAFGFIFISYSFSGFFGRITERNIDMMTELSYLKLNRGDEKLIEEFKSKTIKGIVRAMLGLLGAFAIGVLSSITAGIIMT